MGENNNNNNISDGRIDDILRDNCFNSDPEDETDGGNRYVYLILHCKSFLHYHVLTTNKESPLF